MEISLRLSASCRGRKTLPCRRCRAAPFLRQPVLPQQRRRPWRPSTIQMAVLAG
jgi:hypothetical protein